MRAMIAHHLVPGEGADRRAHDDVARPVAIVVHAREPDQPPRRRTSPDRSSTSRARPPALVSAVTAAAAAKAAMRVARRKRAIVVAALEAAQQLPVVGIRTDRVDERARAAEDIFHHAADTAPRPAPRCREDRAAARRSLFGQATRRRTSIAPMIVEPGERDRTNDRRGRRCRCRFFCGSGVCERSAALLSSGRMAIVPTMNPPPSTPSRQVKSERVLRSMASGLRAGASREVDSASTATHAGATRDEI